MPSALRVSDMHDHDARERRGEDQQARRDRQHREQQDDDDGVRRVAADVRDLETDRGRTVVGIDGADGFGSFGQRLDAGSCGRRVLVEQRDARDCGDLGDCGDVGNLGERRCIRFGARCRIGDRWCGEQGEGCEPDDDHEPANAPAGGSRAVLLTSDVDEVTHVGRSPGAAPRRSSVAARRPSTRSTSARWPRRSVRARCACRPSRQRASR